VLEKLDLLCLEIAKSFPTTLSGAAINPVSLTLSAVPLEAHPSHGRVGDLLKKIETHVRQQVLSRTAFLPGAVYCLRCESSECPHATPPSSRCVFAGYGDTGRPQWCELELWLSRCGDSRLSRLYENQRELVAVWMSAEEIYARLLPVFDDPLHRYRILGQLCAGWFHLPASEPSREPVAVTVQLVRSGPQEDAATLSLNVVGVLPPREPSSSHAPPQPLNGSHLVELDEVLHPLRRELATAAVLRRKAVVSGHDGSGLLRLSERCVALLKDAARDFEHRSRVAGKRTLHARERARQSIRPTTKAFDEARTVGREHILADKQKGTIVVLGANGRVHVFSPDGKHVTSVVFPGNVVRARTQKKRWVPLSDESCAEFQNRIRGLSGNGR